jgi:hypothetical protein
MTTPGSEKKCNGRAETQFQHGGSRKPSGSIGAAIAERELGAHAAKAKERSGGTTGKQCDPRIPYSGEKKGSIQGRRWTRSPLRGSTRTTWAMQRGGEERKEKTRGGRRGIVEGHAWISRCGVGSGFQEIGCRARVGLWSLDTIGSGLNRLVVPPNKKEINSTTLASWNQSTSLKKERNQSILNLIKIIQSVDC